MWIRDRLAPLPPLQIRMDHVADDGTGTDDRHLDDDVVELLRTQARQCRHLRARFDLEDSHGVRFLQHSINRGIVRRKMREVEFTPGGRGAWGAGGRGRTGQFVALGHS
jgi:hypothetical protein